MLIYDASRDPYHAAVRALAILKQLARPIELEALQIIDLSLLFPSLVVDSRLPRTAGNLRKLALERQSPFRQAPSGRTAIDSIKAIQAAAASTLAAAGLLSISDLRQHIVSRTQMPLPEQLIAATDGFIAMDAAYRSHLVQALAVIPLRGKDGLKVRTKLAEHRYDPV